MLLFGGISLLNAVGRAEGYLWRDSGILKLGSWIWICNATMRMIHIRTYNNGRFYDVTATRDDCFSH